MAGGAALLAALRATAASSESDVRAALRQEGVAQAGQVRCVYLGQRCEADPERHVAHPDKWAVVAGTKRAHVEVVFRWRLPSGDERLQSMRADNAQQRGVRASWRAAVSLQHQLEQAAADAQRRFRAQRGDREARRRVSCAYLGRRDAEQESVFVATCAAWPSASGQLEKEFVVFRWQDAAGHMLEQDVRADHVIGRGLRLPLRHANGTLSDPGSASDLGGLLKAAAARAEDRWTTWGREEHGRSIACTYLLRPEVMS